LRLPPAAPDPDAGALTTPAAPAALARRDRLALVATAAFRVLADTACFVLLPISCSPQWMLRVRALATSLCGPDKAKSASAALADR